MTAGTSFVLVITNKDATSEEFESHDLRIEKVLPAGKALRLRMPALKKGTYNFIGDFNQSTAKGRIIAEKRAWGPFAILGIVYSLPMSEPHWDTSHILNDHGFLGSLFGGLVGYRARPSAPEVVAYLAFLALAGLLVVEPRLPRHRRAPALAGERSREQP